VEVEYTKGITTTTVSVTNMITKLLLYLTTLFLRSL